MKKLLVGIVILAIGGLVYAADKKTVLDHMPQKDLNNAPIVYAHKLYLIDVWATWCPPCRKTIPDLIKIQETYASKGVTVIGLSVDTSSPEDVYDFTKKAKINYPVAMAGDSLNYLPPVRGIPTMFLMNNKGVIVKRFVGYTDHTTLAKAIDAALQVKQ